MYKIYIQSRFYVTFIITEILQHGTFHVVICQVSATRISVKNTWLYLNEINRANLKHTLIIYKNDTP